MLPPPLLPPQDHDIVALLEDDDRWEANFLSWSLSFLERMRFRFLE